MNRKIAWILVIVGIVVLSILSGCLFDKAKDSFQKGQKLQQKGEYEAAIAEYKSVITNYPDSPYASMAKQAMYEFPYGVGDTVVGEDWKIKVLSVDRKDKIERGFPYKPVHPSKESEVLLCVKIDLESVSEITEKTYLNYGTSPNNTTDFPITNGGKEYTPIGATMGGSFFTFPLIREWQSSGKIIKKETIVYSVPRQVKGYKLKFKDFPSINIEQKGIFP